MAEVGVFAVQKIFFVPGVGLGADHDACPHDLVGRDGVYRVLEKGGGPVAGAGANSVD